jgi:PAS domain S-box-containing protein
MHLILNDTDISFNALFHKNPTPMWIVEIDTMKFKEVNSAAIKHYGYSREEFLTITLQQIRPLKEHEELKTLIKNIKHNQTIKQELTHLKKDGTVMFVNITSYTVLYQHCMCRMVIIHDVTEQRNISNKLKEAADKITVTLESITDGFMTLDRMFRITYYNKEAERILEITKDAALHHRLWTVNPLYKHTELYKRACLPDVTDTMKFEEYIKFLNKWISFTVYPANEGFAIYFQDITSQKHYEEQLIQHNKSLIDIAHMNSHGIRKPLANMLGIIHSLEDELHAYHDLQHPFHMLKISAQELDHIVQQINSSVEQVYKEL